MRLKSYSVDDLLLSTRRAVEEDIFIIVEMVEEAARVKERLEQIMERYGISLAQALTVSELKGYERQKYLKAHRTKND